MPIESPRPAVDIPYETIYEAIFADLTSDEATKPAVIDTITGLTTTYGELRDQINAFATALRGRGVGVGDVVALHCPNSAAFVVAFHGIMRAGATVTTVGSLAVPADIAKQLADSGARLLLTATPLADAARAGAEQAGWMGPAGQPREQRGEKNEVENGAQTATDRVIDLFDPERGLRTLLAEGADRASADQISPVLADATSIDPHTHVAALPYSSGTTGIPKGVKLSHRNIAANIRQVTPALQDIGLHADSRVMGVLPFFHIYGMNVLLNGTLRARGAVVTMPKFDLEQFLQLHQQHSVDFSFIAPPIAVALAKHPVVDNYDLSSLKYIQCGAASLDKELAETVQRRLDVVLVQGFGMTEASPVTHNSIARVSPLDSIGSPLANTEFKVMDLDDAAPPDQWTEITPPSQPGQRSAAGEMWVRGPQVMLGYLNNEEATRATLLEGGWLRTGDIVNLDHEGNAYVVDRAKELIKYKGYQVAPAELEALILTRPDVADVAVVGQARPADSEEVPHAFVVPAPSSSSDAPSDGIDPEELLDWVAERVAPYKKVREVTFVDAIPKSATGKILRKDLKGMVAQR